MSIKDAIRNWLELPALEAAVREIEDAVSWMVDPDGDDILTDEDVEDIIMSEADAGRKVVRFR